MAQDQDYGPRLREHTTLSTARFGEVLGVLAAVLPCGVLAGLYLASDDPIFLIAGLCLAAVALAILFIRNPHHLRHALRRWVARVSAHRGAAASSKAGATVGTIGKTLKQTFTRKILKLLGVVAWFLMWGVTAAIFANVAGNANITGLVIYVAVGAFSPFVIYLALDSGVKSLGKRLSREE